MCHPLCTYEQEGFRIDKIFKGAKPVDLLVQQATKFEFVINVKAAKARVEVRLDESDNVRQGFVNPAEFVKLHDNLPRYLKPIIEFLYLTGMRSGAAKRLEHKHVDLEAQVIRLPIELSKNKKGLTIPLSGRLLVLVESAWNNRSLECPYLFHHRVNRLETSGRHLTPLARLLASKESYLTIFVDLLCGISFELVSKSPLL